MNKLIIITVLFLGLTSSLLANPNLQARKGILIDYDSNEILYELYPYSQILV